MMGTLFQLRIKNYELRVGEGEEFIDNLIAARAFLPECRCFFDE
jgi:hypothetical protein